MRVEATARASRRPGRPRQLGLGMDRLPRRRREPGAEESDSDPAGHALLADYGKQLGLWYTDAELAADEDDDLMDPQLELMGLLQAGLPVAVRALHANGIVERIFGTALPITFSAHDSHAPAWGARPRREPGGHLRPLRTDSRAVLESR